MKRCVSVLLAVLLFAVIFVNPPQVYASSKVNESRTIAIVFDNSGSMYEQDNKAWCRATYAMEVFASMLNAGDTLMIYPMHPIEVDKNEYTMEKPFVITDASQSSKIREIYTKSPLGTPIESIDCAAEGLKKADGDKKYLIVLTDGSNFDGLGGQTPKQLGIRFEKYAGKEMTAMYLGIGKEASEPDIKESEYIVKKKAKNSEDVLSALTEMCNLIFGRDSLPKGYISKDSLNFDISMKKLIVFVQGEDVADLKVTGPNGEVGTLVSSAAVKYSKDGCGIYKSKSDESLQGMMVTYEDCPTGEYSISYSGKAKSVEAYYEPDADLDFVFTDAAGNTVDPNFLYEGDYKVSFGMKDAKTGELISSELLGNPHYEGCYYVNGEEVAITHDGYSGETPVALKMNDTFDANLTVTYLSGYTIYKDSSDFNWPEGGIQVAARPAGDMSIEISGGDEVYSLQDLLEGSPFTLKVYYQGEQLTGSELESVIPTWNPDQSNAGLICEFADDHFNVKLVHKNPDAPQDTVCGECTVPIGAVYTAQGSKEAHAEGALSYNINDDFSPLVIDMKAPQDYIVISDLGESMPINVSMQLNGTELNSTDFAAVELKADCGGIEHSLTPDEGSSSYKIQLKETPGIKAGDYEIKVTAYYTDHIGRVTEVSDSKTVTLGTVPVWVKWAFGGLLFLLLFIIVWIILHIKVLPKHINTTRRLSTMNFDGDDVTQSTNFAAEIKKKGVKVQSKYAGKKFGISMDVVPGKESYLYKPLKRKSAEVKVATVRKFGQAKIQEALIGSAKYVADENTGKLVPAIPNQKPFTLTNGMMVKYSGTIQDAGIDKDFEVMSKLNFKKQ